MTCWIIISPTTTIAAPATRTRLMTIQRPRATSSLTGGSIEYLPQVCGRIRDRFGARRKQLRRVMIAPGDADRTASRRNAHLDVVDGIADHHRIGRPRSCFGHRRLEH